MNLQARLDEFREDNPYDVDTQAKRLLATDNKELIIYVLALGLATAKQRQRHAERDYIKTAGQAPQRERLVPGRVTGSVVSIPVKPSRRIQNAMQNLIVDVWRIGGEQRLGDANATDLANAVRRENASAAGHGKNAVFYEALKKKLKADGSDKVRDQWQEKDVKKQIETVYGEFRKSEAGVAA